MGGAVQKISDFDIALSAAKARQDTFETQTVPAIDHAISDASDRITAARTLLDSEIGRATGADQQISQRVDGVAASIDPAINAKASQITTAFTAADKAIADRATVLEASASPSGGNLVPNSSLSTLDGWALSFNADNLSILRQNLVGAPYMIGGVENNLTLYRASAGAGLCCEAQGAPFAVRPGSSIQCYAVTAAHRSRAWVSVFFYDAQSNFVGYGGENFGARINAGGQNIADWDVTGVLEVVVPASAISARVALRLYDVQNDGYAWFSRPFVTEVRSGTKTWAPYSAGNDRPVTGPALARLATVETATTDGRFATALRASNIETSLGNAIGRISTVETATTDGRFAAASRVSTLESDYGGTKATVTQQAGTIAGLGQKTAAYVKIVADAGGGRAALSLWSDQYGGAWMLTGDGLIAGNLVIDGTISARQIKVAGVDILNLDRTTMTSVSQAQSSQMTYANAAVTYAAGFSGSIRVRTGGTIFVAIDAYSGATTSDDQSIYNSFDLFTSGGSLVASIRLPYGNVAGSAGYLMNYLVRVANTFGDDTFTWKIATRRNPQSGYTTNFGQGSITVNWTAL